jgi:hypothetical protein
MQVAHNEPAEASNKEKRLFRFTGQPFSNYSSIIYY